MPRLRPAALASAGGRACGLESRSQARARGGANEADSEFESSHQPDPRDGPTAISVPGSAHPAARLVVPVPAMQLARPPTRRWDPTCPMPVQFSGLPPSAWATPGPLAHLPSAARVPSLWTGACSLLTPTFGRPTVQPTADHPDDPARLPRRCDSGSDFHSHLLPPRCESACASRNRVSP